jgi:hypothetical protein
MKKLFLTLLSILCITVAQAQSFQRFAPSRLVFIPAPADVTPPTLTSTTVASNGTTVSLVFSESVTRGAGYSTGHFDLDGLVTNNSLTYVSGDGTSTWTMTAATTILSTGSGDIPNIDFTGTANSVEDGAGNDLATIVNGSVTNNSTQTGAVSSVDTFFRAGGDVSPISNPMSDGVSTWNTSAVGVGILNKIQSGVARATALGNGISRVATPSYGASQTARIKMNFSGGPDSGAAVRIQSPTNASGYYALCTSATNVQLYKAVDNGTTFTLGSVLANVTTATLSTTDLVEVRASGTSSTLLEILVNGVAQTPAYTDSTSPYTTGQPGCFNDGNGGQITYFSASSP